MTWRYRFVLGLLIFGFFTILARLFYWQVVMADELSLLGEKQYGKDILMTPYRGSIKTSDGYPIATNKVSYLVFANPKVVRDKKKVAEILSSHLKVDEASISASLEKDLFWVPLAEPLDVVSKEKIEHLKIDGIGFHEKYTRFYPEASVAAHLIGFVGKNEQGQDTGYFGLEGYYDRQLRGKFGRALQMFDALGRPIVSKSTREGGQIDGRSLVLSLDRTVQFLVERKLRRAIEKYQAEGGMVGIMNPTSGNIIAMASFPSFDQARYPEYNPTLFKNPFITSVYEPGSTFKSFIMAAALNAGVVKPETKCPICDGPITIADYTIRTWDNKYHKDITMTEVVERSDNTGMVFVGNKLGVEKTLFYLNEFGIGEMTGIDLQGEIAPTLRPAETWLPIDLATSSFGQGISVTPIELLSAFSSIANGGKRMEPHVVSQIETHDGKIIHVRPKVVASPISSATAKVMTEILVKAVNNGEAKWAKPKGYTIAGKTGTAQIPISGHYDPHKTIASFIGFAPANSPKFSMIVIIDRPTTSIYGSETAAPLFFDIAKDLLAYYKISPTVSENIRD